MLELTYDDFHRAWRLVERSVNEMAKEPRYSYSHETESSDRELIKKLEICWRLNLRAVFHTKQIEDKP